MIWQSQFVTWLVHSTIFGAILLLLGGIAVWRCRQPVDRIRIIRWTFAACLLVPLIQQATLIPGYSLGYWTQSANDVTPPVAVEYATSPQAGVAEQRLYNQPEEQFVDPFESDAATIVVMDNPPVTHSSDVTATERQPMETSATTSTFAISGLVGLAQVVYLACLGGWLLMWGIGLARRSAIIKGAELADERLRAAFGTIAGRKASGVRLLVTDHIDTPVMWGLWRATIVIPKQLAAVPQSESLRWGLAHEWSHVIRGDIAGQLLANLAKLTCFYQPVYWWMRRQLTLSQDYLADAFAAAQGSGSEDYAEYLLKLVHMRRDPQLATTLGIKGHRSDLSRRVRMLISSPSTMLLQKRRTSGLIITLCALLTVAGLGAVRLHAAPSDEPVPSPQEHEEIVKESEDKSSQPKADAEKPLPDPITYTGKVIDRETGAPIAGAIVEVTHELSREPGTGKWVTLHTTTHTSDENGQYSFTLPPEEVAQGSLYLVVDAHHPDYQPKGRSGYSHSMIRTNLDKGEPPFYETIKLSPGESVTALVVEPDGTPAANVQVLAYTKRPSKDSKLDWTLGGFQYSQTDENGRLRIVAATPGDGVLWVFPQEFSPLAIRLGDRRGDFGTLQLEEGTRVAGRILDAQGNPVPNVAVNLRRRGDGDEVDEFLGSNAVANAIGTGSLTDSNGRFQLKPLPPGTYRAEVEDRVRDQSVRSERRSDPLQIDHVFSPFEVTIEDGVPFDPVEIRAAPHVIVRGRFFNGNLKPRASHQQRLFARVNGQAFFTKSNVPMKDGWFEYKVPHGAENVEIHLSTNEHSSLRWRLSPEDPWTYGRRPNLGTLEQDFTTLEVIRYAAPMLLLKAVDEEGNQLRDFKPKSTYTERPEEESGGQFISGALGDVGFESQPDGRWRSSQLLPDAEITITLEKEGYTTEPQVVNLKEKEERELVFVMKKSAE